MYHTIDDDVLATFLPLLHGGPPVGAVGLQNKHEGVHCIDVSQHFDTFVHFHYKHKFHEFAVDSSSAAVHSLPHVSATPTDYMQELD